MSWRVMDRRVAGQLGVVVASLLLLLLLMSAWRDPLEQYYKTRHSFSYSSL